MKRTSLRSTIFEPSKAMPAGIAFAVVVILLQSSASAAVLAVSLGAANDFAVLSGAGITVAGTVNSTTITGNIGSFATTTITGLENVILNGVNHAGDAVTQLGKFDLGIAYTDAAGRLPTVNYSPIYDLGGQTLVAGVYNGPSSFSITGTLTLDAGGDPNAVWIFQAGSTLITGVGSNVLLVGGAQASNIFWQVGSSATLGTNSHFEGTILASQGISLNTGAVLTGRALAKTGAVTMDYNIIAVPEVSSTLLFGLGMVTLLTTRRRRLAC
jgi:hypothetical protein